MHEVFSESIRWVNLPFTFLLGVVVLYWLMVALGVLDVHLFGDVGADGHFDAHGGIDGAHGGDAVGHADPHLPGDKGGHFGKDTAETGSAAWWSHALSFLNVGEVPLMLVVSILVLCMWTGSILLTRYVTEGSVVLSLAALLPNFVVAVIVTRYVTLPFKPLFRVLTKDHDQHATVIGQRCVVVTTEATPSFGQVEVKTAGAPLLLNVRTMDDARLPRGSVAVVVREDRERGIYFIAPLPDLSTQTHTH